MTETTETSKSIQITSVGLRAVVQDGKQLLFVYRDGCVVAVTFASEEDAKAAYDGNWFVMLPDEDQQAFRLFDLASYHIYSLNT